MAKRQRQMAGVNDLVVSLVAKGLTTGEVAVPETVRLLPVIDVREGPRAAS